MEDPIPSVRENMEALPRDGSNTFALTTNAVTYANGLLIFQNKSTFDAVMASLGSLDTSTTFRTWYLSQKDSTAADPDSPDYVEYPALQAFEERFPGYHSLRKQIKAAEYSFYESGGNPGDFEAGDIESPLLQTVLSTDKAVKIGDIIFRDIDAHHSLVILDGNLNTLTAIRNTNDVWTPALPANVVRLDDRVEEDQEFGDGLFKIECTGEIGYEVTGTHSFKLECFVYSLEGIRQNNLNVTWEIKNNDGVIIFTGTGLTVYPVQLNNAVYPLTVRATASNAECNTVILRNVIGSSNADCNFVPDFIEDPNNLGLLDFFIASPSNTCCGTIFNWSVRTSNQTYSGTTTGVQKFRVNFGSGDVEAVVTVTMINPAGCTATQTFGIRKRCVDWPKKERVIPYTLGPSVRRGIATLWVDNKWFYHSFGSSLRTYLRKDIFGFEKWRPNSVTFISFAFRPGSRIILQCDFYFSLSPIPFTALRRDRAGYEYTSYLKKVSARTGEVTCDYIFIDGSFTSPAITLGF